MKDVWASPWNAFNSSKILMHRKHLEACAKGEFLIPVMADIDPSGRCNYSCKWCNATGIINNKRKDLPEEHWLKLADFLAVWGSDKPEGGIKSICVSGGGSPFMNPATPALLERLYDNKIETGVITNGSLLTDKTINILAKTCRWVGFSMDASTVETFNKIKGLKDHEMFNRVCDNLKKLAMIVRDNNLNNGICFKFLMSPENYTEIYSSAVLAKSLGVHDFHVRPVGYLGIEALKDTPLIYTPEMLADIDKQLEEAFKLQDSSFNVYGIRHKFRPDLQPMKNFSKCWAIPLLPTFGADGNVYYCFDIRGRKDTVMCQHSPDVTEIASFWNSQKHKDMVNNFDVNSCTRCTFSVYNEVVEKVFIQDNMYRNFI